MAPSVRTEKSGRVLARKISKRAQVTGEFGKWYHDHLCCSVG
uniref:Uncharacterized protein n=1 Tax=Arundo donax TaxID=35708 RepID=A0A0A8YEA4_ARUDO